MAKAKQVEVVAPSDVRDSRDIAVYQQAHETRRRWEGYIWSWGILVTALVSLMAGLLAFPGGTGMQKAAATTGLETATLQKLALVLLTVFLASIFLNVYRARCLMKQLEMTIKQFHSKWGLDDLPVVPLELDQCMPRRQTAISSTKLSAFALFLAFAVFASLTVYVVFWR